MNSILSSPIILSPSPLARSSLSAVFDLYRAKLQEHIRTMPCEPWLAHTFRSTNGNQIRLFQLLDAGGFAVADAEYIGTQLGLSTQGVAGDLAFANFLSDCAAIVSANIPA